jgi:hypothetical protein
MSSEITTTDLVVARQWLRGKHSGDLESLSHGVDVWGKKIKRSKVIKDEATRQLKLREAGAAKVRGVLKAAGKVYTDTSGWWIVPFITTNKEIAFVNIAHGVAVASNVQLDEDTIEALTVPDQGEGVKASGAAVWTSPDAGVGFKAKSPPGWVQLGVISELVHIGQQRKESK